MRTTFSYTLRGLRRRRTYTYLVVLTTMVAIATLFTAGFFLASMERGLQVGVGKLGADIIVVPAEVASTLGPTFLMGAPSNFYMDISVFETIKSMPHVDRATYHFYFQTIPSEIKSCCTFGDLKVIGFDPETDFIVNAWLMPFKETSVTGEQYLVVGSAVPVSSLTGYRFSLFGEGYVVKGQLEPTGIGYIDSSIFIPMNLAREIVNYEPFQRLTGHAFSGKEISAILIKVDRSERIGEVMMKVDEMPGVKAVAMPKLTTSLADLLRSIRTILWPFVTVVLVMSIVGITVVFLLSSYTRKREIGLLRAIGASRRDILGMVVLESAVLSLVGGSIGLVAGGGISWLIDMNTSRLAANLPLLYLSPVEALVFIAECLACSLIIGVLSSLYPAYRLLRMSPDDALRV